MKKIYLLLAIAALTFNACSDSYMEDVNTDETKAGNINPNAQLTTALLQTYGDFQVMDTYRNYITGYTQHFAGGWNVTNFAGSNNYDDTMASLFDRFYSVGIKNLTDAIYHTEKRPNLNAALRIQKVYMISILTDAYGDVPCSEAGLGFITGNSTPKYDKQEDIYNWFFDELAACVAQIGTGNDRITGDVTNYNGNLTAWKKYANSLRMRYAMRISAINPTKAKEEFEKAVNADGGYIDDPDFDAYVKHIDVPFTLYDGAKVMDFRANALSETHYGQDYSSPAMICASFFDIMKNTNDPRLYRICRHYDNLKRKNTKPDDWSVDLTDEYLTWLAKKGLEEHAARVGESWYAPWLSGLGFPIPSIGDFPTLKQIAADYPNDPFGQEGINDNVRLVFPWLSIEFERPDRPGFLISSAEVHFLLAEAKSLGWTVPGNMKDHFEAGIKDAMRMLNIHYLPAVQRISDADIDTYIAGIASSNALNENASKAINTQAYILHLMNPSEAWANLRRSDYPVLVDRAKLPKQDNFTYPDNDLSTPDRLHYPLLEAEYNKANYQEAIDRLGGTDDWHKRVWWDVKHGNFE